MNDKPAAGAGWRGHVLSPATREILPVRFAFIPAELDAISLDTPFIPWRPCEGPLPLPAGNGQELLVDFGRKTTGLLHAAGKGIGETEFALLSGPTEGCVRVKGKLILPGDGAGVVTGFQALRFLRLRAVSQPVPEGAALHLSVEFTAYPGDYAGHFLCSDEELNRIWYVGAYTIHLNIQPHKYSGAYLGWFPQERQDWVRNYRIPYGDYVIWDGPRRDREVWLGDMWPEMHSAITAFGATDAVRSSLAVAAVQQREDGSIPGSALTLQNFAEYSCWWTVLLDRLHMLTADDGFVADMEPALRRQLEWLRGQIGGNGGFLEIGHRQTWAWTLARRGVVTVSQCVAYGALRGGARLLRVLGDAAAAQPYDRMADELLGRIRTELWDDARGVFKDCLVPPDDTVRVSCDSNALALLFRVALPDQARRAMRYLQDHLWTPYGTRTIDPVEPPGKWNWAHNRNIWPFVVGLEVEGRLENGDFEGAMRLMRACWGNMVRQGTDCFWEMVDGRDGTFVTQLRVADTGQDNDTWDSYAHGWSAGVTYLLQAHVLGVQPVEPGYRRFRVQPQLADLAFAEGDVPTPHGPVRTRFERKDAVVTGEVVVPVGTVCELVVNGKSRVLESGTHRF